MVVTGSGGISITNSAPFLWSIEGRMFGVLFKFCSRVNAFRPFAAVSYRWSVHSGCKELLAEDRNCDARG